MVEPYNTYQSFLLELCGKLPLKQRLLALDVGRKTVGVAISDLSRLIGSPLKTHHRASNFRHDATIIKSLAEEFCVGGIVVGYPIQMDGKEGRRCQSVRAFVRSLQAYVKLPMILWDERFSTIAAREVLQKSGLPREKRKQVVDKMAAAYILQSALDYARNFG